MALLDLGGHQLVLGSASPRRAQLLASIGLVFEVLPPDVDETAEPGEGPADYVARLSAAKATAISAQRAEAIVVAADTTVDVDGQILGKPADAADLRRLLTCLSGRTHHVHTAVTLSLGDACRGTVSLGDGYKGTDARPAQQTAVVTTAVTFAELTEGDIDWYVATGDGFDKAGGYGIQGAAAAFVESVDGSVTNVIGLPLAETMALIRTATHGSRRPGLRER